MPLHSPCPAPRLVVLGANLESLTALETLLAAGIPVHGLLTLPAGAAPGVSDHRDLHPLAVAHGIPVIDTTDVNDPATLAALRELAPDWLFVLGWSQLLSPAFLAVPRLGVVGSHPADLPRGRGRAPVPWAILEDDREGVVSFFLVTPGVDAGPLLHQERFPVPERADAGLLYGLVAEHLGKGFVAVHAMIRAGTLAPTPQDEARASWRARRTPADGRLDFAQPATALDRLVRAVTRPYPGAYTWFGDAKVTVWRAELEPALPWRGAPGQILTKRAGRLYVQAADRPLWLYDLELGGVPVGPERFPLGARFGVPVEDEIVRLRAEVAGLAGRVAELEALVRRLVAGP